VEWLGAYQLFGHPLYAQPALGGRLHWATAETTAESPGHVEGALAAAERAAAAVLAALRVPASSGRSSPGAPTAGAGSAAMAGTGR
jgi:monoamine oxidase